MSFDYFKFFLSAYLKINLKCTLKKKILLMSFDCFKNFLQCKFKFSIMIFDNPFENDFKEKV